jgi:hypothetical protein
MDEVRRGNPVPGGQFPVVNTFAPGDGVERVAGTDCVTAYLFSPLAPPLTWGSELTAPPCQEGHTENKDGVAEPSTH